MTARGADHLTEAGVQQRAVSFSLTANAAWTARLTVTGRILAAIRRGRATR
jgi:hypothetical protein